MIDNWAEHSSTEDAVSVALQAGRRYVVKLEYFELAGAATARFLWASQSQPKQVVPKSQLYPAAAPPPPPVNTPPTASLSSPAAGSKYAAPAIVSLAASASDSDGTVSRVEFLANGTLVGTDTTAPYEYSWTNVPTGNYNLIARAVDDDGAGTNSGAVAIEVTTPPPASDGSGTGLSAQYFDNPDLAGSSALSRVDAQIDFGWGMGSPGASLAEDDFSVRWTGELEPRYSQTYTLSTVSDDGVRLWLDGQLLIDNWSEHASTEDAVSVPLQAGRRHVVKLEYFELAGAATARFLWSSASQPRQVVPKSQLLSGDRRTTAAALEYASHRLVDGAGCGVELRGAGDRLVRGFGRGHGRERESRRVLRERHPGGNGLVRPVHPQLGQRSRG